MSELNQSHTHINNETMTNQNIAQAWYIPEEITVLKSWLLWAALINLLIIGAEYLRENNLAMQLTALGFICLVVSRFLLPKKSDSGLPLLAPLFVLTALSVGIYSLSLSSFSLFDLWSRLWLIIPAGLTFYWLLSSNTRNWCKNYSPEEAERGLARNKRLEILYEVVSSHTLLIHASLLVIIPVVWIIDLSFSPGNALGGEIGDAFTMEHYYQIIGSDAFWIWTKNSVTVAIGTTIVGLSLAIPAGYAFSRYDFTGKKESMFAFMLIQMFPGIIILVPYFMVMKTLGLLNTSIGLIIAYSVTALPLCVWMLKGFFDTVPRELEEAAMLDGCNQMQIFIKIVLPLSLPAVAITGLFSFLAAWNEFLLALVFNTSNEEFTLPVGLASLIPNTGQRWGDFAAASLIVSTPVIVLFMLFQKSLVQGMSAGAVKG